MCTARPAVSANLAQAGVVSPLVKLLELQFVARPGLGAYRPSVADTAAENGSLLTILLAAIGHLAVNNVGVAAQLTEAGVIPLIVTLLRAQGPKDSDVWIALRQQAEFALRACSPQLLAPASKAGKQKTLIL